MVGHGVLTDHILAALGDPGLGREYGKTANDKGQITFNSLFDYLADIMPPDQQPHFFGAGKGGMVLATHPDLSVLKKP